MKLQRFVLRVDGTREDLAGPVSLAEVRRLIGAATLDTVAMRHMGPPLHVMLVDDNGYQCEPVAIPGGTYLKPVRALKPVNEKATELYRANCWEGSTHKIVGDVVVMPDEDFAE